MKIALTGHRPTRLKGEENSIENWVSEMLMEYKCTEAISGMAQGADQIFAQAAINLNIPLVCCYPYKRKSYHPKELYIMDKAKDVRYISDEYIGNSVYFKRDKYMVDNCDILLAVWDGEKQGGTWITIDYANKIGKPIIYYKFKEGSEEE